MRSEAALLGGRACIEKLGNGSDELSGRERLCQHDAVGDSPGCPIVSVFSAHVNDRKVRVDFSGMLGDIPPVEFSPTEIDVRDERPVFAFGGVKQLDGIFAGRRDDGLESALAQAVFDDVLNKPVVFHDQDKQLVFHWGTSGAPQYERAGTRGGETIVPEKVYKSAHN
jgi:hypothetical protein